MTDEELEEEFRAVLLLPPDPDDDGVSGTPEGDLLWDLMHTDKTPP